MKRIAVALLLMSAVMCSPEQRSNLGVEKWSGWTLDGQHVRLASLPGPALVVNFYSPICKPCIEELPALERFYEEARRMGVPMFLALEPDLEKNGIEGLQLTDPEKIREQLVARMMQDISRYNIKIPVLIMDPPFQIDAGNLVTGTPETLLFRTSPLRLHYNFIGPLTSARNEEELKRSSRYQFALFKLKETVLSDSAQPDDSY